MRARLNLWLDNLRTGFWFLPLLMLGLAIGAAILLLWVDRTFDPGIHTSISWAYSGGPEGARSLLTTIAGSMITAATVTFSLAAVALSIASQQYGSRILRNFLRDRITQVLLGTFTSTFIYCVLVVGAIRGTSISGGFVPAVSVTAAIAFALLSLVLLIFFVHHISISIRASHIVRVIQDDLSSELPRLFPFACGEPWRDSVPREELRRRGRVELAAEESDYLQSIDTGALFAVAREESAVMELLVKPGDHIVAGSPIVHLWGIDKLDDTGKRKIARAFLLCGERTAAQDIRYQFQQLTEVIVRALSPGINDPFTAIIGIDQLTTSIADFVRQPRPAAARQDADGELRLIAPVPEVSAVLDDTVGHIAIYAARDRFIMRGLRRLLDVVEGDLQSENERRTLAQLRRELDRLSAAA
ncbi:MAG: DUF2254 domain-containing protein [Acidobacteriaceae bacterium]